MSRHGSAATKPAGVLYCSLCLRFTPHVVERSAYRRWGRWHAIERIRCAECGFARMRGSK